MWNALRAEMSYFQPWILGGLGIAAGVLLIMNTVFFLTGNEGPPSHVGAGLSGFFPIIAGMVVAFISQGYLVEERRARLLMMGTLTPNQLGWMTALLPIIFVACGIVAGFFVLGLHVLITGVFEMESLRMVIGFAGMLLAIAQVGPLAHESTAAHRQQRTLHSRIGWSCFVVAIAVLTASQLRLGSLVGTAIQLSVVGIAIVATVILYSSRTDFTS